MFRFIRTSDDKVRYKILKNPGRHFDLADETKELELLRSLYPELSNDELLAVKERLDGYFEVVLSLFLKRFSNKNIDQPAEDSQ
jgi:hypothetical protein